MGFRCEKDKIWVELYCSAELKSAAKYLINHGNLDEDLLSDALLKVFEKRKDFIELHRIGKLKGYVFQTMYSMVATRTHRENGAAYAKLDLWAQRYGMAEIKQSDCNQNEDPARDKIGIRTAYELWLSDSPNPEPVETTGDELEYSTKLFKSATEMGIKLMRKIEEYDGYKESKPELWEAAQYVKLYLNFGSYAEVARRTGATKDDVWRYVQKFRKSLNEKRMKISVVTKGREPASGMELYRLHYPYLQGLAVNHTADFEVKHITYEYLDNQPSGALESDVYVFSRPQPAAKHMVTSDFSLKVQIEEKIADKVLSEGKKLVVDCDDYWNLHSEHPLRNDPANGNYVSCITGMLKKAHMVTTTSDLLAERMKIELCVEAVVIKNTIPESAEQFKGEKYPSSLVRFGWMGGRFHGPDIKLMEDGLKKLYRDPNLSGKYQICLGGYNTVDNDAYEYEQSITSNLYCVRADNEYQEYLKLNTPAMDHLGYNKAYRRIWAKPVSTYGEGYRGINVALIPLLGGNLFNSCKSELKLIEAGMTGTAAIVSDVPPYSQHLQHEKNCLKVSPTSQNWYGNIRRLVVDEDLRMEVSVNLSKYVRKNFNHEKETNKLATALKKL